jgi:DNA-binding IclR family transcriptional regulator
MKAEISRDQKRALRALSEGCEVAPELADELCMSVVKASWLLDGLLALGLVERDDKPTYRGRSRTAKNYHRYRLKELVMTSAG